MTKSFLFIFLNNSDIVI